MTPRAWIVLGLGLMLGSCSDAPRQAEGPGSETSGVFARVLDSAGQPMAGAAVRLVALDGSWREAFGAAGDPTLARGRTAADGRIEFRLREPRHVALELEDSLQTSRAEVLAGTDPEQILRSLPAATARLHLLVPGETLRSAGIAGTGIQGVPEPDGTFSFRGLAPGWWTVAGRTDAGLALLGRIHVRAGQILDTTLRADSDSVLLDDFADTPIRNRYGTLLGDGWWYTYTDSDLGGTSTTTPASVYDAVAPCPDGRCLDIGFQVGTKGSGPFALVGMDLDQSMISGQNHPRTADFSSVRSVKIRAMGGGRLGMQLGALDASGETFHCRAALPLGSTLEWIEIPMADFVCDDGRTDLTRILAVTWIATGDGHLIMSKVVLTGAGPRVVFPVLHR